MERKNGGFDLSHSNFRS